MPVPRLKAGFEVPRRIDNDALTLRIKPDAKPTYVLNLSDWPGSEQMRREALVAIDKRTHPGQDGWRRQQTIDEAIADVKAFMRWCESHGIESFADLTVDQYLAFEEEERDRYAVNTLLSRWRFIRLFLRDIDGIETRLAWHVRASIGMSASRNGDKVYLSLPEFFAVEKQCVRIVSQARHRVETAYEDLLEAQQATAPTLRQQILMEVWDGTYREDVDRRTYRRHLGRPSPVTGDAFHSNWFALTPEEVAAAGLLLACRTGWNKSVIDEALIGSWHSINGIEQVVQVAIDKPRRRRKRHSSEVLVDYGSSSAGRAFGHIVDATAPARAWAAVQGVPTDRLLVRAARISHERGSALVGWLRVGLPAGDVMDRFTAKVSGDDKATYPVVRRTRQALLEKGPAQNSQRTWEREYAGSNPEVQADLDEVIATGLQAQVDRAEEALRMRLLTEDEAGEDIASGNLDTATASCRDITHNPITGERCRESFLSCLGCSNAVATPRHLPRLTALHHALDDLRADSRDAEWKRWHDDWVRLSAFLYRTAGLTDDAYERYRLAASDSDLSLINAVLNGDLDA